MSLFNDATIMMVPTNDKSNINNKFIKYSVKLNLKNKNIINIQDKDRT